MASMVQNPPTPDTFQNIFKDIDASRPKTGRCMSTWGTVRGVDHLVKADKEEKERQKKKAQLMLYTWELVEQKEKREKEHKLKERVALQHKLIKKCERYIEDKRMSETQRNVKKRQQDVKRRKAAVAAIVKKGITGNSSKNGGTSYKKLAHAEKTPSKKPQKLFSTYKRMEDTLATSDGEDPDTNMEENSVNKMAEEDKKEKVLPEQQQALGTELRKLSVGSKLGDTSELLFKKPENKIAKFIGLETKDHLKMDDLWNGLKSYSEKQLRPLSQHVNRLKSISMPSTKECLEEYEKPLPVDHYTGKPVLLNSVLTGKRKVKPPRDYYIVKNTRSAASDRSNFGTRTIEKLRTVFNSDEIEDNSNWFTTLSQKDSLSWTPTPPLYSTNEITASASNGGNSTTNVLEDIETIQFLTDDGRVLNSSNRNRTQVGNNKTDHRSPILSWGSGHEGDGTRSGTGSVGGRSCSRSSSNSSLWEPLSLAALSEYHGVKQKKITGHGKFSHGSTKIWKQLS